MELIEIIMELATSLLLFFTCYNIYLYILRCIGCFIIDKKKKKEKGIKKIEYTVLQRSYRDHIYRDLPLHRESMSSTSVLVNDLY